MFTATKNTIVSVHKQQKDPSKMFSDRRLMFLSCSSKENHQRVLWHRRWIQAFCQWSRHVGGKDWNSSSNSKHFYNCILADLLVSLLSLSSPTPLSPRSPVPMPPPSLSLSFSPCRREQARLRRRRAGGVLAASAPTASPVVTTETSVCNSVSSLHTSFSAFGGKVKRRGN